MKIGEAARHSGLEASAIRFYEADGVLPSPERTPSGYRAYGDDDVDLMRFVRRLRSLELPLDDIRQIVGLRARGQAPCHVVRAALHREASAIETRIEDLRRLRTELRALQAAAADVADAWPGPCVCHVIDPDGSKETL